MSTIFVAVKKSACIPHFLPQNTDCDLDVWLCGKLFELGVSTGGRFQFVRLIYKESAPTTSDLWQQRQYHTSKWGNRGWVGLWCCKWSCADGTVLTKRQEYCLLISVGGWGQGGGNLILLTSWGKFQISRSNRQNICCWVSAFILLVTSISFWCLLGFFPQWIYSNLQNKV